MNYGEILIIDTSGIDAYVLWAKYDNEKYQTVIQRLEEIYMQKAMHESKNIFFHRNHNEFLIDAVEYARTLVRGNYQQLSYIGVNIGPGSFTGLRIALALAKGIKAGVAGCKIIGLDSMQLLGYLYRDTRPLLCLLDAKSQRFYAQLCIEYESYRQKSKKHDILDASPQDIFAYVDKLHKERCYEEIFFAGAATKLFLEKSQTAGIRLPSYINVLQNKDIEDTAHSFFEYLIDCISNGTQEIQKKDSLLYVRKYI